MEGLKEIFVDSWQAILHEPFPFVVMLLIGLGIGKWHYSERIKILEARLTARDEELKQKSKALRESAKASAQTTKNTQKREIIGLALRIMDEADAGQQDDSNRKIRNEAFLKQVEPLIEALKGKIPLYDELFKNDYPALTGLATVLGRVKRKEDISSSELSKIASELISEASHLDEPVVLTPVPPPLC
jgi:hypothetical protein